MDLDDCDDRIQLYNLTIPGTMHVNKDTEREEREVGHCLYKKIIITSSFYATLL